MTPSGSVTMTTPYGSSEPPFDLCAMAVTAGASYVARTLTSNPAQMTSFIKTALDHKGFSVVEILSQCPTHFGRYALGSGSPKKLLDWIKEHTVRHGGGQDETGGTQGYRTGEFCQDGAPHLPGSTVHPSDEGKGPSHETDKHPVLRCWRPGIILSSVLLGEAAVTKEGLYASSPSPTVPKPVRPVPVRGRPLQGAHRDPHQRANDILVVMFQAAYDSHKHELKEEAPLVDSGARPDLGN